MVGPNKHSLIHTRVCNAVTLVWGVSLSGAHLRLAPIKWSYLCDKNDKSYPELCLLFCNIINTTQSYQCAGVSCAILRSCNYSTHAVSGFCKVQHTQDCANSQIVRNVYITWFNSLLWGSLRLTPINNIHLCWRW